jgi:hypothetical protein
VEEGDEDLLVPTAPVRVACPEDEEFLAALDRMVNENISEAKTMQRDKANLAQLTAPVSLSSGKAKKTWEQLQVMRLPGATPALRISIVTGLSSGLVRCANGTYVYKK